VIGDAYVNGTRGLMLVVEKFPSANTLEVTEAVDQALRELRRGLPGVEIDATVFRLANYIEDSVGNLTQALIIGAILVIFAIGAFLFNWRTAVISLVSIPISLIAAVAVLDWMGTTLNIMMLAGLVVALGVVIDDAIVGVDRFMERLRARQPGDEGSIAALVMQTTLETRGVTVYAALIILMAVMPIFFMGGVSGAFFGPLATSYALAVIASLVVGLSLTPALTMLLYRGGAGAGGESPVARALHGGYEAMLRGVCKAPVGVSAVAGIVVIVGLALWPLLGQSLLPAFKERELLVSLATAPGTSHHETYRISARLGKELESLPGIRNVGAHVGRAITGDQVVSVNSAQLWVSVDPTADYDQVVATVRDTVAGYPGMDRSVQTYLRNTVSEALTGEAHPVVVRVFGASRDILNDKAEEIRKSLAGVDGLVDLRVIGQVEEPQVHIEVDLDKAGAANVNPGEVRRSAATVFSGLTVGFLYEAQKIFDVVVWGTPEVRNSIADIRNVLVEKTDRHHVRLGDVAKVSIKATPTVLPRADISAFVDVVANVAGRDLAAVTGDVESRLDRISFPLEYHAQVLGEFAEQQSTQQRTLSLALAALIGIFLLLQACFRSWLLALIGLLTLPAAVAGGVFAGFLSGGVMTLGSLVGFLAVLGIAARNGIVLINHYQRLEAEDGVPFGVDLVIRGAKERMAPILVSAAAIIAALLPIAAFGQIPGLEIVQPTAIIIIAGVVASTLVTLVVLPALYLVAGARASRQTDLGLADA
jgi:Cu/Ag efflux pump CusA